MSRETSSGKASILQLCRVFGLSRQAYYAAQRAPAEASHSRPKGRAPRGASVAQLEPRIRDLAQSYPAWGVRKIWARLRREDLVVSHRRVWALMKAWGLTLPPAVCREPGALRGHVTVPDSNRRWATDLTTTWTRLDGLAAITLVVDCGDRVALAASVSKSQESPVILGPLAKSLEKEFLEPRNVPEGLELRSDHGSQFTGRDCEELCQHWHLDHTFAPVGRPTGNAVVERLILTLKQELLWIRDWNTIDQLQSAIDGWLLTYNEFRPHQALGDLTPAEKRAQNLSRQLQLAA